MLDGITAGAHADFAKSLIKTAERPGAPQIHGIDFSFKMKWGDAALSDYPKVETNMFVVMHSRILPTKHTKHTNWEQMVL